jgi:hypothetical protein
MVFFPQTLYTMITTSGPLTLPFTFIAEGKTSPQPNQFLAEEHIIDFGLGFAEMISLSGCIIYDGNINDETFIHEHREKRRSRFALVQFQRREGVRREEILKYFKRNNLRPATLEELLVFVRIYREQMNSHPHIALGSGTELARLTREDKKTPWQRFVESIIKEIPKIENRSPYVSGVHHNLLRLTGNGLCGFGWWEDSAQFLGVYTEDIFAKALPLMRIAKQKYLSLEQETDDRVLPIGYNNSEFLYRTSEGYVCKAVREEYPFGTRTYFRPFWDK